MLPHFRFVIPASRQTSGALPQRSACYTNPASTCPKLPKDRAKIQGRAIADSGGRTSRCYISLI